MTPYPELILGELKNPDPNIAHLQWAMIRHDVRRNALRYTNMKTDSSLSSGWRTISVEFKPGDIVIQYSVLKDGIWRSNVTGTFYEEREHEEAPYVQFLDHILMPDGTVSVTHPMTIQWKVMPLQYLVNIGAAQGDSTHPKTWKWRCSPIRSSDLQRYFLEMHKKGIKT